MVYSLSRKSRDRLVGVHPDLRKVVERAIHITPQDFGVSEGVRSVARQAQLVAQGASQTMNSRHITGHAVDLFAVERGKVVWDWPRYMLIADAMKAAAGEFAVTLRWGGAWNVENLAAFDGSSEDAMADYVAARKAQGRRPFLDGPHFELPASLYGTENPALGEREA